METNEQEFFEVVNESLSEYLAKVIGRSFENNAEYKELSEKKQEILNRFPKLQSLVENSDVQALTKEEVGALSEYLCIVCDVTCLEYLEIYYKGICDAYVLFKKLDIIK